MAASEFVDCDMHNMQLLHVIGMTLEQTPHELSILWMNSLVMASRRPIYIPVNRLYMLLSQIKQYISRFMRATHAINNIYKLKSF